MSIFTSLVTKTLTFDEGTVLIRKLNPAALEAVVRAGLRRARAGLREAVAELSTEDMEAVQKLIATNTPEELARAAEAAEAQAAGKASDPMAGYDRLVVAQRGIVSWTLPIEKSDAAIEELDEETLDLIAREVMRLTKPNLFQPAEQAEADRKND